MTEEANSTGPSEDDDEAALLDRADDLADTLHDILAHAVEEDGLGSDGATLAVAFLIGRLLVEAEQAGDCYDAIRDHFNGLVDQAVEAIRLSEMEDAIAEAAEAKHRGEKPH